MYPIYCHHRGANPKAQIAGLKAVWAAIWWDERFNRLDVEAMNMAWDKMEPYVAVAEAMALLRHLGYRFARDLEGGLVVFPPR